LKPQGFACLTFQAKAWIIRAFHLGLDMATRVIPNYALYGDQAQPSWQSSFDFEWIPERSRVYNWHIQPHKHDAFIQVLYLVRGSGDVLVDTTRTHVEAPCLVWIPAQTVHGFDFAPDVDGPVVTAAQRTLESLAAVAMPELVQRMRKPVVLPLSESSRHAETLMPLFLAIERESRHHGKGQMAAGMSLLVALAVQVLRLMDMPSTQALGAPSRKALQLEKFRLLVDQNYARHLPVSTYASQLGITAGQLSRLCREVLGVSSLDVIHARLVQEAQRLLVYTTNSVKQLADTLGFGDEAYFSRFFRKHTGLSPREFQAKALTALVAEEPRAPT